LATVSTDMARIESILREIGEAVVACDPEGRIILYNAAAEKLFHGSGELVLGHSLYEICGRAPLEYTIRLLLQRQAQRKSYPEARESRFVCTTLQDARLLLCSMSLIAGRKSRPSFFILTFEEATLRLNGARRESRLLERAISEFRGPLANLCAAAENLRAHPEMDQEMRRDFERVMLRESDALKLHFEVLVRDAGALPSASWPLNDIYSADLIQWVSRGLSADSGLRVTMTGVPLWLHADIYPLTKILIILLLKLEETLQITEVDMEALLGDKRVYIDIVWEGEPVAAGTISSWLQIPLPDPVVDMTVGEVLDRHGSEIWSQRHRRTGYSLLRIPTPISSRQWEEPVERVREQPIYYDFSLLDRTMELGDLADRSLSSLTYVVFDTETTGLSPEAGDEIISISAVRIVDRRILSGDIFTCLVQPHRPLGANTLAAYGLTAESFYNRPRIGEALRQFRSFVGDSVLVGHNAAFDMKFIRHLEHSTGVAFNNPLLDTLLLSSIVAEDMSEHTLSGIGKKLGIETRGRFTATGDTLATAQIFLALLDPLQEKGVRTLSEAIAASERVMQSETP
jgi:DNA polymerase-3 subunit epsilon